MAGEILNVKWQAAGFVGLDPAAGVVFAKPAGAPVALLGWNPINGDTIYSAPAGSGAVSRQHKFARPIEAGMGLRVMGDPALAGVSAGQAIELACVAGFGYVFPYDRTATAYLPIVIRGLGTINFGQGHLVPESAVTLDIGSAVKPFRDGYFGGSLGIDGNINMLHGGARIDGGAPAGVFDISAMGSGAQLRFGRWSTGGGGYIWHDTTATANNAMMLASLNSGGILAILQTPGPGNSSTFLELRRGGSHGSGDEMCIDFTQGGTLLNRIASRYDGVFFGLKFYAYYSGSLYDALYLDAMQTAHSTRVLIGVGGQAAPVRILLGAAGSGSLGGTSRQMQVDYGS